MTPETAPVKLPDLPALPSWTDQASVVSYLTTIIGFVVAAVVFIKPGFTEPSVVQAIVPSVAGGIAAIAQIINTLRHTFATTRIHVARLTAGV